jgi:hypothetical protein
MTTTQEAKEIDKALAEMYDTLWSAQFELGRRIESLKFTNKYYATRTEEIQRKETAIEEQKIVISGILADIKELNKKYTGWTRAFLVLNSNGHVHKSMECNTCFPTTRYLWVTDLSDENEDKIIELAGEMACTVCYPNAPSEYLSKKCQIEDPNVVEAREARAEAKAKREAKRLATGIWNADGTPVKIYDSLFSRKNGWKSEIKTERTADSEAVGFYLQLAPAGRSEEERNVWTEALNILVSALAVKRGTDFDTEYSKIEVKALKKQIANERAYQKYLATK